MAISRFGSATDTIARFALRKIGLNPGKDVTLIQVGSGPERLSAALTGRVSASVINPPSSFIAEKKGLAIIADVAQMGLVFQHTGAATTRKYIKEHPDTVRRYVRSHVEAVHKMWTDKEATIKALSRYMGSGLDRETLERSYENVMTEAHLSEKAISESRRTQDGARGHRRARSSSQDSQARAVCRYELYSRARPERFYRRAVQKEIILSSRSGLC